MSVEGVCGNKNPPPPLHFFLLDSNNKLANI